VLQKVVRDPTTRIKNVLFDAGGTLVDLDHRHLIDAIASAGAGTDVTAETLEAGEDAARTWFIGEMRRGGAPADAWNGYFTRLLRRAGVADNAIPALLKELWRRNVTGGLWHRPIPGAAEAVARLAAAGMRLAVVSNAEGRVAEDLAIVGFARHFETIVDSHKVGVAKPDPRIFAIALERLGASPEESLYVGDLYHVDVVGARKAGMHAVLFDRFGFQTDVDCPRIERLDQLDAHVLQS
jgi:HAD superfamily hydrolase (TIGR01509 family)